MFPGFYDRFSRLYPCFTKLMFLGMGGDRRARREVLDRLEPAGGRVLEVSVGTGANLPYLFESPDVGEVYGLDISGGPTGIVWNSGNRLRATSRP